MLTIGLHFPRSTGLLTAPVDPYLLCRQFDYRQFVKMIQNLILSVTNYKSKLTVEVKRPCLQLFPEMALLDIVALTNSRLAGPVACAADDLELSLVDGPDQIEFFDNYFMESVPTRERFHNHPEAFPGNEYGPAESHYPSGYDVATFNDFSPTTSMSLLQPLSLLSSFHYEHPNGRSFAMNAKQQPPFVQIQYAANMVAPQMNSYFNDFNQPMMGREGSSVYGSSSESYASPLDEMFFKAPPSEGSAVVVNNNVEDAPLSRKRKYKGSSPLAPRDLFVSEMAYQEKDSAIENSELELPCNLKFEPSKKVRLNSFAKVKCEEEERKEYVCKECDASFKVKSYLTRHMRKHNNAKAFVCPFFEESELECGAKNATKCHPTGGFSRRDTYKTHLKALHFIYPPGTKSSDRNSIGGRCAGCFEFFDSNADWLKNHIEGGACKGTVGFEGVKVKLEGV